MNVLLVFAHPESQSMVGSLREMVLTESREAGHVVRQRDLYAEQFNPVMSGYERKNHSTELAPKLDVIPELRSHIEDLRWCDALVLVYPTWWSGQPAILNGWFDRVLVNEVAWTLPEGANKLRPLLGNIRTFAVLSTHGSSKLVNAIQGEPGKRIAFRSVRLMMHWRTRSRWIGVYRLDSCSTRCRNMKLRRARRRFRRLL